MTQDTKAISNKSALVNEEWFSVKRASSYHTISQASMLIHYARLNPRLYLDDLFSNQYPPLSNRVGDDHRMAEDDVDALILRVCSCITRAYEHTRLFEKSFGIRVRLCAPPERSPVAGTRILACTAEMMH